MSKLNKLLNGVFVSVVFLFTGTRLAIARIFPPPPSSQKPPSAKVFALTEAAWLELRAGANQDKSGSKSGDDKKEPSKSGDCDKGGSKSGDDKKKDASPSADDKKKDASPSEDDKKKDASKSGDCDNGPGGGDGDTGGTGG